VFKSDPRTPQSNREVLGQMEGAKMSRRSGVGSHRQCHFRESSEVFGQIRTNFPRKSAQKRKLQKVTGLANIPVYKRFLSGFARMPTCQLSVSDPVSVATPSPSK
jgi:hypothetical protein